METNHFNYSLYLPELARIMIRYDYELYNSCFRLAMKKELAFLSDIYTDTSEIPIGIDEFAQLEDQAIRALVQLSDELVLSINRYLSITGLELQEVLECSEYEDVCLGYMAFPFPNLEELDYDGALNEILYYVLYCAASLFKLDSLLSYHSEQAADDLLAEEGEFGLERLRYLDVDDEIVALLHDLIIDFYDCYERLYRLCPLNE